MPERIQTTADQEIATCLEQKQSFAVIAGAGSGKTSSLIDALDRIRTTYGPELRRNGQRVACITYTKRAVQVISDRLGYDELFIVSTLHSFLWGEIKFLTEDIRKALYESRIPQLITQAAEKDNGGQSQTARKARSRKIELTADLGKINGVKVFTYEDGPHSRYSEGKLSHEDVIEISGYLLKSSEIFRKAFGFRYPFFFVDEAQDTFPIIIESFNAIAASPGLPVLGYFGDPWQRIYEQGCEVFNPPEDGKTITKTENFRCSERVISFLNSFRKDITQYAAGGSKGREGSVQITLVEAESPEGPRKRYSDTQVEKALQLMDEAIEAWGWTNRESVIRLFLARQMIARRQGFVHLHRLFTGDYASTAAQEEYESGEHFLLKPIREAVWPLIEAQRNGDQRRVIDLLRTISPAFDIHGMNRNRPLKGMIDISRKTIRKLDEVWRTGSLREVYLYCRDMDLIKFPERLVDHLERDPRIEEFNEEAHSIEKGDWLCDEYFKMGTTEIRAYCDYINENTAFSTQHGVKGEEYPDVLVVFDDVEAAWSHYSFSKLLTPKTAGEPTEGQLRRSEKLAYVCFSRAENNLRILMYTKKAVEAREELLEKGLFSGSDISIIS